MRNHFFALWLAFFAAVSPCSAQQDYHPTCLDSAKTQWELTVCAGESFKATQRRLEVLLREVRDSLPLPQRAQLDSAQTAWGIYAATECRMEAAAYEGGSMYSMQTTLCRGSLAARRIAELAPILCGFYAPDQTCPEAERYTQPGPVRDPPH